MTIPAALIVNKIGYRYNFLTAMGLAVAVQVLILLTKSVPMLVLLGAFGDGRCFVHDRDFPFYYGPHQRGV